MADKHPAFDLNHLLALFDERPQLTATIHGHLIAETMLVKAIESAIPKPEAFDARNWLRFPAKVDLACGLGILDPNQGAFLKRLNKLRNSFGHRLDYSISTDEEYQWIQDAATAGFDFNDGIDTIGKEEAQKWMGGATLLGVVWDTVCKDMAVKFDMNLDTGFFM